MRSKSFKAWLQLLALTIVIAGIFWSLANYQPHWVSPNVYYLLGFLFLLTSATTIANHWGKQKQILVTTFVASQVIRMLFCIVFLYFFISQDPAGSNALVINFFIIYLVLLIFEISTLLSNLRAEFRKPE